MTLINNSGFTLIELAIIVGIISFFAMGILGIHSAVKTVQDRLAADGLELTLYHMHSKATAARDDTWITEINSSLHGVPTASRLPWQSHISINSSKKLGYTAAGTTKYSGTATIGDRYKISLGINIGRPNVSIVSP